MTATLSFGYGLSATALQLASAYSVLADNGIRKPVSLLKLSDEAVIDLPRQQVLRPEITVNLRKMLRTVVDAKSGGSALEANVPFYSVAGKTGTAHVVGEKGYEENLHNSLLTTHTKHIRAREKEKHIKPSSARKLTHSPTHSLTHTHQCFSARSQSTTSVSPEYYKRTNRTRLRR